jgi:hypothetical protein
MRSFTSSNPSAPRSSVTILPLTVAEIEAAGGRAECVRQIRPSFHCPRHRDVTQREARIADRQVRGDAGRAGGRPLHVDGSGEQAVELALGADVGPQRPQRQRLEGDLQIELTGECRSPPHYDRPAASELRRGFDVDGPIRRRSARTRVDVAQRPRDRGIHGAVLEHDLGVSQLQRAHRQGYGGATAFGRRALRGGGRIRELRRQWQRDTLGGPHQTNAGTVHRQGVHHQRARQQRQQGDAQCDALRLDQSGVTRRFPRQPRLLHQQ